MTPTMISRSDASARHASHYFTGKPCARGHVALRYVSTGNCVECAKAATKAYNDKARGKVRPAAMGLFTAKLHPDDYDAVYGLVDYLNAQRGLPPAVRQEAPPLPPPTDTRTPWEVWYDRLQPIYGDGHARQRADELAGPEEHSPGWTGPRAVVAIEPPPAVHGGGAKPDWL